MREDIGSASIEDRRQRSSKAIQITFAMLSLAMLTAGLAINWFAAQAGLNREVVDVAAFAMLLAAVAHASVLWLWDR